jgi:2-methylcitrate dehydratase PrpD
MARQPDRNTMNDTSRSTLESAIHHARQLFEWAAAARARPLPETVRRRAAIILADDIGAAAVGSLEPQVRRAQHRYIDRSRGLAEATVFAAGAPCIDRAGAACANGMAITWCELDEGFRNASCHAGAYAIPALLAQAECSALSVDEVLRALAVAYEVTTRFALAYPFPGFYVHPHAAFAAIGAAAAVSLVRGHDATLLQASVTGAASMSFAGPFNTAVNGALVRNAWTAAGAWIGLQCADWAEDGIGGGLDTPHEVFATSFRTRVFTEKLSAGLGETWSVDSGYHKVYACCNYAHAAVEASLRLREQTGPVSADQIAGIRVEAGPGGLALDAVEVGTVLSAKFSLPHAVAATAVLGTGGAAAFTQSTLSDPAIAALRRKVILTAYPDSGPAPRDRPGKVTWTMTDGRSLSALVEIPRGGADQPFDESTLMAKLASHTAEILPGAAARLGAVIRGEGDALRRSWSETVRSFAAGAAR